MGAIRAAAAMVAVAALGACSGDGTAAPSLTVPTRPHDPRFPEGVIGIEGSFVEGTLAVQDGCLGVVEVRSRGFTVVLWPEGVVAVDDEVRTPGGEVFEVGDAVFVGGGGQDRVDVDGITSNPELVACLEATGVRRLWTGGYPGHR